TSPATCRAPFNITFSNQTAGPGNLTYNWDFGNSTTSTLTDPVASYAAAGSFAVKLTAVSDYGCQEIITKNIVVSGNATSFTAPDSACLNSPVNFQNTSSPLPASSRWVFGDGDSSSVNNPVKTFTTPGVYAVKLYSSFPSCGDSAIKNIRIFPNPVADFTALKTASCQAPLTVSFQDISPDAVSWLWNFGDAGTSTQKNPTHIYNTAGTFNVTLTITDSKGCRNTVTKNGFIIITKPVVGIANAPAGGCAPFTYSPVSNVSAVDGVASYFWDFGDGGATSTLPNPSHTYASTGNYTLKLVITTTDGCKDSVIINNAVKVGTPAVVDFSSAPTTACASASIQFTDLSSTGDQWLWDFGDGTTSTLKNPLHVFADTGLFDIKLTVTNNGCEQTLIKPGFVRALPPLSDFDFAVNCANKLSVNFTNQSKTDPAYGAISYTWSFGDPGNSTSAGPSPTFVFPAYGSYNVKLSVVNGACTHEVTKTVKLVNETADFSVSKAAVCRNENVSFTAINSDPANIVSYDWTINGSGPISAPRTFNTGFPTTGFYNIGLTITDINGCTSNRVINNAVQVTGPTARFGTANDGGCRNTVVTFNDSSISVGTIIEWKFDFGDGKTQTFTAPPFTHVYADTGIYTVTLTVKDNIGCSDTYVSTVGAIITKPKTAFGAEFTTYCPGTPLQFRDSSLGKGLTWAWDFGDGGTSTLQDPLHSYAKIDSVYNVKLVITDSLGCSDTLTRQRYISIKAPKPGLNVTDTTTICPPLETKFFFNGKDYESFVWDFGDGGLSSLKNPTHFYNTYGTYTATLYVTGYGGCIDSAQTVVNVHNPYAETVISYTPVTSCNSLLVDFNLTTPSSTRMTFYFGDGKIDSSQQKVFQHFYPTPSFYSPFLLLTDSQNCAVGIGGPTTIRVLGAEPIFGMDRKKFCDSGDVFFTNYTIANDPITSSVWDFGDGNTATTKDAVHKYTQPGLYIPSLTVTTEAGCTKVLTDTVRVLATPNPIITAPAATCTNSIINFQGNVVIPPDTAISWKWDFGNGVGSNLQNPTYTYPAPGNYTVRLEATNSVGCKDTTSTPITIYPLPVIDVIGDTSFIVGTGITIPMKYSSNVITYSWSPSTNLSCTNCPFPFAKPQFTTKYRVAVTDSNGCANGRDVTLIVLCNDKNFFIPNTFSPNNDGSNDLFYPRGRGIDKIQAIRIFNRWGEPVFEKRNFMANDAAAAWDGTYKGKPAPSDTYVYLIDIICENAAVITTRGNVTLLR
ncbi:MAG: PKD domain-containing protein, partial [Gemmatimonadaceae bacterium]|nr:PKD domain-containing protein [Chitinophagaceae bacterium]